VISGFQSSVRINVGPNYGHLRCVERRFGFQSSVRINVGPNIKWEQAETAVERFQSSVRINVGPNGQRYSYSIGLGSCFNPP